MAINPPTPPEEDDDTPKWVKELFGKLTSKVTELEEKLGNVEKKPEGNPEPEPDVKPRKRKSIWFND